jgi:hypothetical protein
MAEPNSPVPNTIQVKLYWGTTTQVMAQNVLHFVNTGAVIVNQALAETLKTTISGIFGSSQLTGAIAPTFGLRNVGVRNLALANQAEFLSTGAGTLGTGTGDLLPVGTAFCVTLRTSGAGKSFRGRVYLAGFTEGMGAANNADAAVAQVAVAFVDGIRTSLGSAPNIDMCIVSRYANKVLRPTPITTEVTAVIARNTVWDSQRRRLKPGGTGALLAQFPNVMPMVPFGQEEQQDGSSNRSRPRSGSEELAELDERPRRTRAE